MSARQRPNRQILVALDHDAEDTQVDSLNAQLLQMATSLALAESAELHAVHAWLLPHEDFLRSARSHLSVNEVDEAVRKSVLAVKPPGFVSPVTLAE